MCGYGYMGLSMGVSVSVSVSVGVEAIPAARELLLSWSILHYITGAGRRTVPGRSWWNDVGKVR